MDRFDEIREEIDINNNVGAVTSTDMDQQRRSWRLNLASVLKTNPRPENADKNLPTGDKK